MSDTGGSDEPTQVNPETTAAMPSYVAPDAVPPADEPEKTGMATEYKWLIVGFVILAAIGITGIVVQMTDDDESPTTTTVPATTQPERPTTSERRSTTEPPTTEDRPATTEDRPATTEAPPPTEASP